MLGCIQPMSSPMMKRMFGFCGCCASAARKPPQNVTTAVAAAITLKSNLRFTNSSSNSRCYLERRIGFACLATTNQPVILKSDPGRINWP